MARSFFKAAALAALVAACVGLSAAWPRATRAAVPTAPLVSLLRVPDQGIQPQVALDATGGVHLVFFKGDPANGDLFYTRVASDGRSFSPRVRVNSRPGSAIATGTVRGAQLAVGRNQRVHVSWNGSGSATPRAPGDAIPMLYTRMNSEGTPFEQQRNLVQFAVGLDGGGAVAADAAGRVAVAWHAGGPESKGEGDRRVWVSRSTDDGATFRRETAVSDIANGACGCCGMAALADREGTLYLLFRSARQVVHRSSYLLTVKNRTTDATNVELEEWTVGACPMSTFALAQARPDLIAAWETAGQVQYARIDPATGNRIATVEAPGPGRTRKHPAIAVNSRGDVLLVWTEGTAWQRGGAVVWQLFDKEARPAAVAGRADGVPVWGLAAAYARPDGTFTIVY